MTRFLLSCAVSACLILAGPSSATADVPLETGTLVTKPNGQYLRLAETYSLVSKQELDRILLQAADNERLRREIETRDRADLGRVPKPTYWQTPRGHATLAVIVIAACAGSFTGGLAVKHQLQR